MVSLIPPPKTNVISSHCTLPGLRAVPSILAIWLARYPRLEKNAIWGGKTKKNGPNFFYGFGIHIKNTFCKKNGSKRSFQPSAVVRAIYPPPIWGPSRQLDDQHRNTNMNNKDHLVGQLTKISISLRHLKIYLVQKGVRNTNTNRKSEIELSAGDTVGGAKL